MGIPLYNFDQKSLEIGSPEHQLMTEHREKLEKLEKQVSNLRQEFDETYG